MFKPKEMNLRKLQGLKLIEQVMKDLERVVDGLIKKGVGIDEMQLGFAV